MGGTPRYLLVGDTHGDSRSTYDAASIARANGVTELVQLGDWGFLWPNGDDTFALAEQVGKFGCTMMFIEGNHDWHVELWRRHAEGELPSELTYLPRGHCFTTSAGTRVGCLGGANSIDRDWRKDGEDWFPEEVVTKEQVGRLPACDVLLTHDAPELPPGLGPPPLPIDAQMDRLCRAQRGLVKKALLQTGAHTLYHGHYHHAYAANVPTYTQYGTSRVYGLSNNGRYGALLFVDETFQPVEVDGMPKWW